MADQSDLRALREAEFSTEVTEPLFADPVAQVKRLVINRGGQAQSLQVTEYEAMQIVEVLRAAFPGTKVEQSLPDPAWAKMNPAWVVEFIREETNFDAAKVERMLQFAIDAAKQIDK